MPEIMADFAIMSVGLIKVITSLYQPCLPHWSHRLFFTCHPARRRHTSNYKKRKD